MAKDRKIDMLILGLLAHENLSGYDIKKRIDGGISFFWKGSFGNIYPSLSALERAGSVTRLDNTVCGGREKICYSITQKGMERLALWLKESKAANDLKYETLLKIFFGAAVGTEATVNTIREFRRQTCESLNILRFYQNNLSEDLDHEDHLYYYLTVSFGVESYEGYLRWCDEAVGLLESRCKKASPVLADKGKAVEIGASERRAT